jgi:lipid A 3-O-deacylase
MKLSIFSKNFLLVIVFLFLTINVNGEENKIISKEENRILNNEHELNFYTGMFDFSDAGKSAAIVGFQHQNENLMRDSFLGTISPITGALITADNASYVYTGVQAQYKIGNINLTPSFAPGMYNQGNGKDLGHIFEFKSEVQLSLELPQETQFGFSYNHISNASLGDKNPGANSYMFNFLKKF